MMSSTQNRTINPNGRGRGISTPGGGDTCGTATPLDRGAPQCWQNAAVGADRCPQLQSHA